MMSNDVADDQTSWWVYMLKCSNGAYYTGATNDLKNRVEQHQAGEAAKYTRSHLPVELVYFESAEDRSSALKREHQLKQQSHQEKQQLAEQFN